MPHFFFHIRDRDSLTQDVEGVDLPDLDARAEALSSARDVFAEQIVSDGTLGDQQLEICDAAGQLLATVPFRDAIRSPEIGATYRPAA